MPKKKREPKWLRKWKAQEKKAKSNWSQYELRDRVLKELGFNCYADYLASPLWQEIRVKVLTARPGCSCCQGRATVIHHDSYYKKLLLGDEVSVRRDLYPLCSRCHRKVEFEGERKRSWGEAIRMFRRMLYWFRNGKTKGQMIREKIEARRREKEAKRAKEEGA